MSDTRPFDPVLFGDAAIDAETANLNAQMIQLLHWPTGVVDHRRRGRAGCAPAWRRGVPSPRDVAPGADRDHHWQQKATKFPCA